MPNIADASPRSVFDGEAFPTAYWQDFWAADGTNTTKKLRASMVCVNCDSADNGTG